MDPRERAEAALARARARGSYVVTPDDAVSPMDAKSTLQIPRSVILAAARMDDDPEATMVVPAPLAGALGDDRTTSMPSPAAPQNYGQDTDAYESYPDYADDNPLTHSPRTQPLYLQQPPRREPETVHEEQDGIIPTTTTVTRRTLAQRLNGE
ncbi:hypothetical protein [Labedaea rhizosphaerae]|uniref:Uncharacterized protein n=1 Tax=Labedaea rhizosphaerae TaxID=598644 RepID=A0A4R6S322_LABRH|nr:hypothetical protein [Labedaea rhizosphaerae]TDP93703.1 hypothetical protein EV186_10697 [Labedaea rhizosphaerae]